MSGHQQRDAFVGGHIEKELEHGCAGVLVERAGGLVGEKNFRVVHQRATDGGALALAAGELLDLLIQAMGEAGALGELVQALIRKDAIRSGGDGRDETVLGKREVGNKVVKLKDEADFVAQQLEQIAMTIDFDAVDDDVATIWSVKPAKEVEQGAFAAAGRTAKRNGLALHSFKVDPTEHSDCAVVVGLPDIFGAEDDLSATSRVLWPGCSFESKRLHRTDAHRVCSRIESARDSGKHREHDHDEHEHRLYRCVNVTVERRNVLERQERSDADDEAGECTEGGHAGGFAEDHGCDLSVAEAIDA